MRKLRLLLACCVAAAMAVPLASPAAAQEVDCSGAWIGDYIFSIFPPAYPVLDLVVFEPGTITIRGDEAAAYLQSIPEHYKTSTEKFLACLEQEYVEGLVLASVRPTVECGMAALESFLSDPDLMTRYVHVGTDLVVTIDYGRALEDADAIALCI